MDNLYPAAVLLSALSHKPLKKCINKINKYADEPLQKSSINIMQENKPVKYGVNPIFKIRKEKI